MNEQQIGSIGVHRTRRTNKWHVLWSYRSTTRKMSQLASIQTGL